MTEGMAENANTNRVPPEDVGDRLIITTSAVPHVSQVYCYDETIPHIGDRHPELRHYVPSLEHAVHDTIQNPTHVVRSNSDIHVGGFKFCSENHIASGNNHLVVAVKVVEGTSALLKTAYFTDSVSGTVLMDKRDG